MNATASAAVSILTRPFARIPEMQRRRIWLLLLTAAAILFPILHDNDADVDSMANAAAYATLALGLNIVVGFAGLRAFTAAVLGGIGNVPGAMVGGVLIGLIEAMGGQFIATAWTDVIIFSILVLVLVFKPVGLFGRIAPNKS